MTETFIKRLGDGIDPNAIAALNERIREVDGFLRTELGSNVELVESVAIHTLDAGGKRLRPALVTLAAGASGGMPDCDRTLKLGAAMEMIHMATLIHDDVVDHSDTRRGAPTAAALHGATASVLSGDVLLAKAMRTLALDGDLQVIRRVSEVVVELAEGEVLELQQRGDLEISETEHRRTLALKTATFIEVCCEVGAMCAGASAEAMAALKRFGFNIGMAFQLIDDLIDYRSSTETLGKPRATDFREGCATLPLIYLLPTLLTDERAYVASQFGTASESAIDTVVDWMETRGIFERVVTSAERHITEAQLALSSLPKGLEREALLSIAEMVLARTA